MKKTIIALILILSVPQVACSDSPFGISVGTNLSFYSTNYTFNALVQKVGVVITPRVGVSAAIYKEFSLSEDIGFRLAAQYSTQNIKIAGDYPNGVVGDYLRSNYPDFEIRATTNAFEFAPSIRYSLLSGSTDVYVHSGPSFQFLYLQSWSSDVIYSSPVNSAHKDDDMRQAQSDILMPYVAFLIGGGISTDIAGQKVFIELQYNCDLTSIVRTIDPVLYYDLESSIANSSIRIKSLKLLFGVAF